MLCPEFEATHVTGPNLDLGSKTSGQSCGLALNISFQKLLVPSVMGVLHFWGICKSICGFSNCVFPTGTISARSSSVSVNNSIIARMEMLRAKISSVQFPFHTSGPCISPSHKLRKPLFILSHFCCLHCPLYLEAREGSVTRARTDLA